MTTSARRESNWPVAAAVAVYVGLTAVLIELGVRAADGHFVYALDDPYIHLSVARNLAEHGVWGIRPDAFAPVSSSPAWTVLLALLHAVGASAVQWPLILNVAAGMLLVVVADISLRPLLPDSWRSAALLGVVLVSPLPALALTGMEHSLQIAVVLPLACRAARHLEDPAFDEWPGTLALIALSVALRYEDAFLAGALAACLLWRRRPGPAILVVVTASLPVVIYGAFAVTQGGGFFPSSILMKTGFAAGAGWPGLSRMAAAAVSAPQLWWRREQVVLTLFVVWLLASAPRRQSPGVSWWLAALFVQTSLAQFALVRLVWFFRYEAFVIALGVVASALLLRERLADASRRSALVPWLVLPLLVLAGRAGQGLLQPPQASREIYSQQIQLAALAERSYPRDTIAVNDIGAVSYYSTSAIFDIAGLATADVAAARRAGALDARRLDTLMSAHGVSAIAMYTGVLKPLVNTAWCRAGAWTMATHVAASEATVEFFARGEGDCARLREALAHAGPTLPSGVTASITGGKSD